MKAIIQRVKEAKVIVGDQHVSSIGPGLLTFLGVAKEDSERILEKLISKILKMRIFSDENGKMNKSLIDIRGEHLIVSQFTLNANYRKGNRPSFEYSMPPEEARRLYEKAIQLSQHAGVATSSGEFAADMQVHLVNDGPVTLVIEY